MLRELHIQNLALIEDARVELGAGFNCFTGQTGAGKSLLLGALEILLGLKQPSAALVRPGCDESRVTGVFELHDPALCEKVGQLIDQTVGPGEELLITRKLFASGRSSASINGQTVTAGMVRAVSELLVDIHGQHDQQYLLKPSNQTELLDALAGAGALRESYAELHRQLTQMARRRRDLAASRTLRQQQLELYEFQASEIDEARLMPGEFESLRQQHSRLANLKRIGREATQVHLALEEQDDALVGRLQALAHLLEETARLDPQGLGGLAEQVATACVVLQDSAFELGRYLDHLELDPEELAQVEDRLNLLNRLISKYASGLSPGQDAILAVLAYRDQLQSQLDELRAQDEDLSTLDQQASAVMIQMRQAGAELSRRRQAGIKKLRPQVDRQLQELGMHEAEFDVAFVGAASHEEDGPHAPAALEGSGEATWPAGVSQGLQVMEMMVRTNPGQPFRPLRQIASGGEMSRLMLALKAILAHNDRVSVLVFDEIDANIGGRMGTVVGQKLRALAKGASHQVLCITHLPQIAAFADHHLHIHKEVQGKGAQRQTRTCVCALTGPRRVEELAQMLAGQDVSATTRRQVREMLKMAG